MKGGVAKTTTAIILADALSALEGLRVLAIDLDPQANMSWALLSPAQYNSLGEATLTRWLKDVADEKHPNIFGTFKDTGLTKEPLGFGQKAEPAHLKLAVADTKLRFEEMRLDGLVTTDRAKRLFESFEEALTSASPHFDVCIFDCSPALSILTAAGLKAANSIIIPTPPNALCLESSKTFRDRALREMLGLETPCFILKTRVSRHLGQDLSGASNKLIDEMARTGQWTILNPVFQETKALTKALRPPETGPYKTVRSKYGRHKDDLVQLVASLKQNGVI
jgi:cellulose biosynthesis protein BcsQ